MLSIGFIIRKLKLVLFSLVTAEHNKGVFRCFYRSSPSISDCILLQHVSKQSQTKRIETLGGRFIEMKTIGELSSGRPKGGRGRLIEV